MMNWKIKKTRFRMMRFFFEYLVCGESRECANARHFSHPSPNWVSVLSWKSRWFTHFFSVSVATLKDRWLIETWPRMKMIKWWPSQTGLGVFAARICRRYGERNEDVLVALIGGWFGDEVTDGNFSGRLWVRFKM